MVADPSMESLRETIIAAFPDLAGASFALLSSGWDYLAVDVDDRLIFRFPRDPKAEANLATEARILDVVRPAVRMPVPELSVHPGSPAFSRHAKLPGEHLLSAQYATLPGAARAELADSMVQFYVELHRIDDATIAAAGAAETCAWLEPEDMLRRGLPLLPVELRDYAERAVRAWQDLGPDPHGTTYGYFDGHGWNMAFDHARQRLNGLYDFGDSGFGPLHREFVYPNFIDRDLTARIATGYEALTGRALDRERIELLSTVLRLSELAEQDDDPVGAAKSRRILVQWAADAPF